MAYARGRNWLPEQAVLDCGPDGLLARYDRRGETAKNQARPSCPVLLETDPARSLKAAGARGRQQDMAVQIEVMRAASDAGFPVSAVFKGADVTS